MRRQAIKGAFVLTFAVGLAGPLLARAPNTPAKQETTATAKKQAEPERKTLASKKIKVNTPGPMPMAKIPQNGEVVFLPITGVVDLGMAPFVTRVVEGLDDNALLILDVNTPGGRIDAAEVIRDAILGAKARTVCWIHPRAISAGAFICLAADVIVVTKSATIGAATVITIEGDKVEAAGEKMTSFWRAEMRATAEAKGRNGDIAAAMVDRDLEVPGLSEKGKVLTMDAEQTLAWGLASAMADSEKELFEALERPHPKPATISRPTMSWAEDIARFLSGPTVSGLLMSIGMLGILIELYSGGSGIGLILGLTCLGLFFFGHHVVSLAGIEEILLLVVGLILLAVEIFLPGYIVPGILGVLCIVIALAMSLVNLDSIPLEVAWEFGWFKTALARVLGSLMVTAVLGVVAVKFLPKTRLGRAVMLEATLTGTADDPLNTGLKALVGQVVRVATDLRPAGKVVVDGRRIEAVSERGYIEANTLVRVLKADRHRLVVREVSAGDEEKMEGDDA